jgi:L-lactate utilization protein LutB
MSQALSKGAIVRNNQETFAVLIQPPDIEDTRPFLGKKVKNSALAGLDFRATDVTDGLVQNGGEFFLRRH